MTLEKIAVNASRKYRTSQSMVADGLREVILSGALQEGQPLRQEEIANLFGVSRVPPYARRCASLKARVW